MARVIIILVAVLSCIALGVFSSLSDTEQTDWNFSLVPLTESNERISEDDPEEEIEEPKPPRIGIDLGLTYSSIGVFHNDTITILTDEQGNSRIPSCVAFTENGEVLVGHLAKKYQALHPENTVCEARRLIGKTWDVAAVEEYTERFLVKVEMKDGQPYFVVHEGGHKKIFSPVEISALIISKLKKMAEDFLGQTLSETVIAVPSYFNDKQRQAIRDAAGLARLNISMLTTEVFGYDFGDNEGEEHIIVYDLGMTSLVASTACYDNGVFEVLATAGSDDNLIDYIITHLLSEFQRRTGKAPSQDAISMFHLRREVESAVAALTTSHQVSILLKSSEGPEYSQTLTRTKFDKLAKEWLRSSLNDLTKRVMKESDLTNANISAILLSSKGDSSHLVPHVQQVLQEVFDDVPKVHAAPASEEVLVRGTAMYAHRLDSSAGEVLLCCGMGSSVGIETHPGAMHVLIPIDSWQNKASAVFTTATDNQSAAIIKFYAGERPITKDNILLGQFTLDGLRPSPRGVPRINVTLLIDPNNKISANATDLQTGNTARFQETEQSQMLYNSDQRNKSMIKEDRFKKLRLRSLNYLQKYVYSFNKELRADDGTLRDSLRPELKLTVSQAVEASLRWLDENPNAKRKEFQEHHEQLKAIIDPIISDAESFKDKRYRPEMQKLKDEL